MKGKEIFFRVDASKEIGMGHLMRSLALAQGARRAGYSVAFITRPYISWAVHKIEESGFKVFKIPISDKWDWRQDAEETMRIMNASADKKNKWLVTDNYFFGPQYQKFVKAGGHYLVCIDDVAKSEFFADIVINHGIHAGDLNYKASSDTLLLLGPKYGLLREDILKGAGRKNQGKDKAGNILITMGGVYKEENIKRIYRALASLKKRGIKIRTAAGANDMSKLYRWADLVISTASTSISEACYYGLTGVVCIVAENQERIARKLKEDNIFFSIGWLNRTKTGVITNRVRELLDNKKLRQDMSKRSKCLVDGKGVNRIIRHMKRIENEKSQNSE